MSSGASPAAVVATAMVWRFGAAQLDESRMELSVGGAVVALERKPLEVLRHLLRHAGEVVTRDELAEAVWPGRILSETVLAKAVSRLREVLDEEGAKAIKTVHGYGYRLLSDVSVAAPRPEQRAVQQLGLKQGDKPLNRPNWQLESHLDSGGRGEVWCARHIKTGERRVFKFALNAEGLSGLKREVTLHRLFGSQLGERAPMVPVLDFNLDEAPFFLEMNYIEGGNLAKWLERQGGIARLPLANRLALFIKIAQGVAQAHAVGVLHKDLKPANILIEDSAQGPHPLLADFGSAGVVSDHILTEAGITKLGFTELASDGGATSQYLAPEVLRGQLYTTSSDLYALGVMLYQLVAGDLQHPVSPGWEADVADPLLREDIAAAVQGDPARRLSSVSELAQRLENLEQRRAQRHQEILQKQQAASAEARSQIAQRETERLKLRRKWVLATASLFLFGAVLASLLALRASRAASEARRANASTQATMQFLVNDVLGAVSLREGPAKHMTLNQIIERAARKVDERFVAHDKAARAQTYRALYEVYGVTDYKTLDFRFNDWLHDRATVSLADWFKEDPGSAFASAFHLLMETDFWNNDAKIFALLQAAGEYGRRADAISESQRMALDVMRVQWQIKRGDWPAAQQAMKPLAARLSQAAPSLLVAEPYALVSGVHNTTRLGMVGESQQLCGLLLAAEQKPPIVEDAGLRLDVLEACAVSATYRGDAVLASNLANRGMSLARENYDEQVGYVATFARCLATAQALSGRIIQGLAYANYAVQLRRQNQDDLLPYALTTRGNLLLAAKQPDKALADLREASEILAKSAYPMLASEAHARLVYQLASQNLRQEARQVRARIAPATEAALPATHRLRAELFQADAWLHWLDHDASAASKAMAEADHILAAIGYAPSHLERMEIAADLERMRGSAPASEVTGELLRHAP